MVNNGGKTSRICLQKHLGSVTEAPRLAFSSRKQFFSPKTAEIHHQGDPGSLEQPPSAYLYEKGGGGCRPAHPGELSSPKQARWLPPEGTAFWRAQVGLVAICTPVFTKYTPYVFFGDSFFVKLRKLTNFVTILVFFP